jgi:putative aminopeptidase FrvX
LQRAWTKSFTGRYLIPDKVARRSRLTDHLVIALSCHLVMIRQTPIMASLTINLKHLSNAIGVSGDEGAVRQFVLNAIRAHVDDVRVDALGNVLAIKHARRQARLRVMLDAHLDEVGFMIVGANEDGTLKFRAVGGIAPRILPGKVVLINPDRIPGVIGTPPVHVSAGETHVQEIETLSIDIGAASKDEALNAVRIGHTATFATHYLSLGTKACGKAFDDRAGCAALIELLRGPRLPVEILAAFTVQEEVGLRGAAVAAHALEPDAAIAIDATPANDLPPTVAQDVSPNTRLGDGPAIYVMTRRDVSDPRLVRHLSKVAEAQDIPHQVRQPGSGGTNASSIMPSRAGVPTVSVSVPARYIHSPVSIIDLADLRHTVELVRESVARLTVQLLQRS